MYLDPVDHEVIVPMIGNTPTNKWVIKYVPPGIPMVDVYFDKQLSGLFATEGVILCFPSGDKKPIAEVMTYIQANVKYEDGTHAYGQRTNG